MVALMELWRQWSDLNTRGLTTQAVFRTAVFSRSTTLACCLLNLFSEENKGRL